MERDAEALEELFFFGAEEEREGRWGGIAADKLDEGKAPIDLMLVDGGERRSKEIV